MVNNRLAWIALLSIAALSGCSRNRGLSESKKKDWPPQLKAVNSKPNDITVLSGTTFKWGETTCQLLGVKESEDPNVRKQAEDFSKKWFRSIGNLIAVYNSTNELVTDDGIPVVWIRGYDTYLSCLSEELVRAGLVEIDERNWQEYSFMVPTKEDQKIEDWRGILQKAKEGHKRGDTLKILFHWSP